MSWAALSRRNWGSGRSRGQSRIGPGAGRSGRAGRGWGDWASGCGSGSANGDRAGQVVVVPDGAAVCGSSSLLALLARAVLVVVNDDDVGGLLVRDIVIVVIIVPETAVDRLLGANIAWSTLDQELG
jgi:hypothetical protein